MRYCAEGGETGFDAFLSFLFIIRESSEKVKEKGKEKKKVKKEKKKRLALRERLRYNKQNDI